MNDNYFDFYEQPIVVAEGEQSMPYYNTYSNNTYSNSTKGDEVINAILDAYATGVEFETLISKNSIVRQYWYKIQSDKALQEKARKKEKARLEKLAIARAAKEAAKKETMTKLTQEEIEAFGLVKRKVAR